MLVVFKGVFMTLPFFEAILAWVNNFFDGPPEEPLEDRMVRAIELGHTPYN